MPKCRRLTVVAAGVVAVSALCLTVKAVGGGEADDGETPAVSMHPVPSTADSAGSAATAGANAVTAAAGPTAEVWGVPVGYPHTAAGAAAAAVGWVSSLGSLMRMGPIARADTLGELMTVEAARETITDFDAERDRFVESFGADPLLGLWIDAPLQVSVMEADGRRAVVQVWSLLVLGTAEREVQGLWRTHTVTVRWERDDWRVEDVSRVEGPTPTMAPARLPSPPADLAAVAAWTPAVFAGVEVTD
jgi:hypothetical protein